MSKKCHFVLKFPNDKCLEMVSLKFQISLKCISLWHNAKSNSNSDRLVNISAIRSYKNVINTQWYNWCTSQVVVLLIDEVRAGIILLFNKNSLQSLQIQNTMCCNFRFQVGLMLIVHWLVRCKTFLFPYCSPVRPGLLYVIVYYQWLLDLVSRLY